MTGAGAVTLIVGLQTITGVGVIALFSIAHSRDELLRLVAVAPLAGMAWTGIVGATLATVGSRLDLAGLVVLAVATAGVGALRMRRSPVAVVPVAPISRWRTRSLAENAAVAASLGALGTIIVAALAAFRVAPVAAYDGWAMWGMKARAISELGGADPRVFASPAYERLHLEYPLLLPALHALPLQADETFSSNTIVLSCLAFGLAGLIAVWGLLRDRVRASVLLPTIAAIATAPAFFGQLATGYADVPLAMLIAAGVVTAACWLVDRNTGWLALVTIFFAAAALTKNEGLLFAAASYIALAAVATGRRQRVALSGMVVALLYAPWKAYATYHHLGAPDYDLSSSFNLPWVLERLDRGPIAAESLLREALGPDEFGLLVLLAVVAIGVTVVVGPRDLGFFGAGFAALSLVGITWVYVLTPYELTSYLGSNGDRVIMAPVLGAAALVPLLVEETALALRNGRPRSS